MTDDQRSQDDQKEHQDAPTLKLNRSTMAIAALLLIVPLVPAVSRPDQETNLTEACVRSIR